MKIRIIRIISESGEYFFPQWKNWIGIWGYYWYMGRIKEKFDSIKDCEKYLLRNLESKYYGLKEDDFSIKPDVSISPSVTIMKSYRTTK